LLSIGIPSRVHPIPLKVLRLAQFGGLFIPILLGLLTPAMTPTGILTEKVGHIGGPALIGGRTHGS